MLSNEILNEAIDAMYQSGCYLPPAQPDRLSNEWDDICYDFDDEYDSSISSDSDSDSEYEYHESNYSNHSNFIIPASFNSHELACLKHILQDSIKHSSYVSYLGSDEEDENEFEEPSVKGQWTRLSALKLFKGTSDNLYYHVAVTFTFGFEESHEFYNYAKKFLKACKILGTFPDPNGIVVDKHSLHHFRKLGIILNDPEFQKFAWTVNTSDIPSTSILYDWLYPLSDAARWRAKRKMIIDMASKEIIRIIDNFDHDEFTRNLSEIEALRGLSEGIISGLIRAVHGFVDSFNLETDEFKDGLRRVILKSIAVSLIKNGIRDKELVENIWQEVELLLSSPLDLVYNYSEPDYYCHKIPDESYPIFD